MRNDPRLGEIYQARLASLLKSDGRKILGIVGAPGSGKSYLARALLAFLGKDAVAVPMDGYHLANVELARLGRSARKGAEDTFDGAGFVALLARIKNQTANEIIYAPEFRREIEEPIANAIPVFPETKLVITEGNYLLLERGHWAGVRPMLDEVWYVDVDDTLRRERLIKRHTRFGRTLEAARAWVENTDEPNAVLIGETKAKADCIFRWEEA